MLYVTFCYAPDAAMLSMAAARIRELDHEAKIYAVNDPAAPIKQPIPGVNFTSADFPRGGNLNGLATVAGELAVYEKLLKTERADYIIKFDCDLWANNLKPFLSTAPEGGRTAPDYLSVERFEPFVPSGMIYRLSRWAVAAAIKAFNARSKAGHWVNGNSYPEDITIYNLVRSARLYTELVPFASGYTAGMNDAGPGNYAAQLMAGVVHCGEPLPNGQRVSREHATLRMRILKHETEKKQ